MGADYRALASNSTMLTTKRFAGSLIQCFRERASLFGSPCQTEQKAFWDCYQQQRVHAGRSQELLLTQSCACKVILYLAQGVEGTKVRAAVSSWFEKSKANSKAAEESR